MKRGTNCKNEMETKHSGEWYYYFSVFSCRKALFVLCVWFHLEECFSSYEQNDFQGERLHRWTRKELGSQVLVAPQGGLHPHSQLYVGTRICLIKILCVSQQNRWIFKKSFTMGNSSSKKMNACNGLDTLILKSYILMLHWL